MQIHRFAAMVTLLLIAPVRADESGKAAVPAAIEAGVAAVDITPDYPVRLSGFGFRRTESEGVTQQIWAKALAIGSDKQGPAVVLAVDNVGLPEAMVEVVAARLKRSHGIERERFAATFTHTHTAPMLNGVLPTLFGLPVPPEHQQHIDRYTQDLTDRLEEAALAALADRKPARLSWGVGSAAISKNRRTPGGPVDHDLPLLAVKDLDGKLRAVWISYACHCVTLSNNRISGDWAGYAQEAIQRSHPGAVALVSVGCGADTNPLSGVTGDKVEIAAGQGAEIAAEVERMLGGFLAPITQPVSGRLERFDLPLDQIPDRAEWERRVAKGSYIGHHAQVQLDRLNRGEKLKDHLVYSVGTWTFGDELAVVFLPGEVVVDYSLRLKRELDRSRLWVNGYSNAAPCYIPSERVLREGGYEGATAMTYYDLPTKFAPGLEDKIISAVRKQLPQSFQTPVDAGNGQGTQPLSPQQSGALIRTKPGFVAELVAAEPLISDPVAIDFGPDGRLWVAEMHDYPSGLDGDYSPGGRVRLLTDADGDGRYDFSRVFLDGIPFPTGVTAWRTGVLVCAAPDIIYAEDTNGDDVADVRRVLYHGFGTGNYQARVNSLAFGLDNWIYGSCGLFGGEITSFASDKPYALGDRDFRVHPDSGEIESATGRTQQGRARDDWGNWFACDNSNLARHYPLAEHYLRRNPFVIPPSASVKVPGYPEPNRLHPASQALQRFKLSGPSQHVTAACGLGVYRDELLGEEFSNNLFTCEPVNLVVHRLLLEPNGATFTGRLAADETESEFLASTDNWFRPVQARTGPDGALYVVDMYRYVIEHPRWIPPEALVSLDVRAGQSLGRIYRVYASERRPRPIERLDRLDTAGLVAALDSPNGPQRDLAQAMLQWRDDKAACGPLTLLAGSAPRPQTRLQALCALDGLQKLDDKTLLAALADAHAGVRRQALRLAEPRLAEASEPVQKPESRRASESVGRASSPSGTKGGLEDRPTDGLLQAVLRLTDDADPQVQLQLAYSLGETGSPQAATSLAALLVKHRADPYLSAAAMSSLSKRNFADVADAVIAQSSRHTPCAVAALPSDPGLRFEPALKAADDANAVIASLLPLAVALENHDALGRLLSVAATPHDGHFAAWQFAAVAGLLDAVDRRQSSRRAPWGGLPRPPEPKDGLGRPPHLQNALEALFRDARTVFAEDAASDALRLAAARLLGREPGRQDEDVALLAERLSPRSSAALQAGIAAALGKLNRPRANAELLDRWNSYTPSLRSTVLDLALGRPALLKELMNRLAEQSIAPGSIDAARRQALLEHRNESIREAATKLFAGAADANREKVVREYFNQISSGGDRERGKASFAKRCAACHRLDGVGHVVGPDLAAITNKSPEFFLISILDPNRVVDGRYQRYQAVAEDGRTYLGLLAAETAVSVTLVEQEGKQHVLLRNELEELAATGKSLMPEGLEKDIQPAEMSDLLAYLQPEEAAPPKSPAELAAAILDDERPAKEREAIIAQHAYDAGELVTALAAGLDKADEKEEYRRIPWIWRVAIAAGRRAAGSEIKSLLAAALPQPDQRLADWQAVVIGGGVINGVSQSGHWPGDYIGELIEDDGPLIARWLQAIQLSSAMADNAKVRNGTRYDALRIVAMGGWDRCGEQLTKYLAEGRDAELQMGAISGLADVQSPRVGPLLLSGISHYTPTNRALALDAVLRDESRIAALLDAIAAGQVSAATLGDARVERLLAIKDPAVRARANMLFGRVEK